MSLESVPGHEVHYHLLSYDRTGAACNTDSLAALAQASADRPTDVFVFSHGWNGDVPAARAQYGAWIATMASSTAERERARALPGGFRSLCIGLHWPSKAWGDEEIGSTSFAVEPGVGPDELASRMAGRLGDTPEVRAAVGTIVNSALEDPEPETLPRDVVAAYEAIDRFDDDNSVEGDRSPFDAELLYQGCRLEDDPVSFGGSSLGGILAPLQVLTFWKMKKRAMTFGESGAAVFVRELQRCSPGSRIHLMGHSFGCIVASAAAAGASRPVASLSLFQGAMSLWSYCSSIPARPDSAGHFRPVIDNRKVTGPIVVTTSVHDRAVGTFYPLGAWSGRQLAFDAEELPRYGGIGVHGLHGPDVDELSHSDVRYVDELTPGRVHNVDARSVVATGSGIAGAHSDICHPELGRLVWRAVTSAR
ncbi:alpha/beta hydrolase [Amycolatopsis sp. NPDC049691]|uniref:alpha/beta hydrolase n=1 Tax=Amycolatopsis sp. NPDC049691 TaxID=3155155 RepID=UPI003441E5E2